MGGCPFRHILPLSSLALGYLDRSMPYLEVPLPKPSSAASSDTLVRPAACATLSAGTPGAAPCASTGFSVRGSAARVTSALEIVALKALPVLILGGFTSIPGAIVGGLIIGAVESLSGFYLPEGFKDVAAYVVVLLMLMVKPNGLFGETMRKKV